MDKAGFAAAADLLAHGLLREAIGYRVDSPIPYYRGIAGYMVEAPMLWIRHSRFPILFIAYDQARPDILRDVVKQLEIAKSAEFFALLVVVPTRRPTGNEGEELRHLVADSIYRYDFVVLDREHLTSIIARGSSERLVEIILDQGIELSSLSPYVVRGPVPEKMFFGREREIKAITQTIQHGNYAVVGGRRIGKSSTLLKIKRLLGHNSPYRPIYVNCEDKFNRADFFQALAEEFGRPFAGAEPQQMRYLVTQLARETPGARLVFLLDEVDELLSLDAAATPPGHLFKTFRALAHEGLCRFVFSGSRTLYQHLRDPQSPFFNFVEHIALKSLERKSVAEIVTEPLRQLGVALPDKEALIARLFSLTAGHPNLVQWLCDRLLTTNGTRRKILVADLERVASEPEFQKHFVTTAWGEASALEKLITLLPEEIEFSMDDLAGKLSRCGIEDTSAIRQALEMLDVYAVLERRGSSFRFVLTEFPRIVRLVEDVPALTSSLVEEIGS